METKLKFVVLKLQWFAATYKVELHDCLDFLFIDMK